MRSSMRFPCVWLFAMMVSTIITHSTLAEPIEPIEPIDRGTLVGSDENVKVLDALDQIASVDFQEAPLQDVLESFEKTLGFHIELDLLALADIGIKPDMPVSLAVKGISHHSVLNLLLREHDLTTMIRDGTLTVTSAEERASTLVLRIYHVEDFVRTDNDWGRLIDSITLIEPTLWDVVGGSGSITPITIGDSKMLVVNQIDYIHPKIAMLFSALRKIDRQAAEGKPRSRILLYGSWSEIAAREKIEKALAEKVTLKLVDTPLKDVVTHLRDSTRLNVLLDRKALDDVGLSVDCSITLHAKDTPLKTALRQMLRPHDLTCFIGDGVLTISTSIEGHWNLSGLYPVTDLVSTEKDLAELAGLIRTTVDPMTWDEVGGPGCIIEAPCLPNSRVLLIQQEPTLGMDNNVHDQINALLETLRREAEKPIGGKSPDDTDPFE